MPKRSNTFQKLVFLIKKHSAEDAIVTESKFLRDNVTGAEREVDICIETVVAGHQVVVSIECRNHKRRQGVGWIEEMKAKHERLPTNVLVLISSSGFTPEAIRVASTYGIEVLSYDEVDDNNVNRLFGNTGSLWSKVFSLSPTKVVARVKASDALPAEDIVLLPDHILYDYRGHDVGFTKQLVEVLLNADYSVKEFGRTGDESHKGFVIHWEPVNDKDGNPICLQKIDPLMLRPIEYLHITGTCNFDISEFKLKHGILGNERVAWGRGTFLGKKALLLASEDDIGNKKLTISTDNDTTKG